MRIESRVEDCNKECLCKEKSHRAFFAAGKGELLSRDKRRISKSNGNAEDVQRTRYGSHIHDDAEHERGIKEATSEFMCDLR